MAGRLPPTKLIEILPRESRVVFERLAVIIRVFVRQVRAERVRILPAPDDGVGLIHDHPRGVEVVGVDVMHLDLAGGGFRDNSNRNVTQPQGFLPYQSIICWRYCESIFTIFYCQFPGKIIQVKLLRAQCVAIHNVLTTCVMEFWSWHFYSWMTQAYPVTCLH
ncbi:MAG: hypothetical protein A4S08_11710 [Proteobacteria bacterium SG_bin4]|nr:MAG: hypothetical protein A4S08_11710 [Proteobacteria bacterium SG_bin4]